MIKLENVNKSYGKKKVLENISFTLEEGHILGLIGINGAGKSTLLRILAGVYREDSLSVFL